MDDFFKAMLAYFKAMWNELRKNVLGKGKDDIWHRFTKFFLTIPVHILFPIIALTVLLFCILLVMPIGKLCGYDLASVFAEKQAALQTKLKPALWLPGISRFHSARQKWNSVSPAETIYKDVLAAAKKLEVQPSKNGELFKVVESNRKEMRMKVLCLSKWKWLDVIEMKVDVGPDMGGAVVDAFSYSTGLVPLSLPPFIGVLTNVVFFWVPFIDFGRNNMHLEHLRRIMKVETEKEQ